MPAPVSSLIPTANALTAHDVHPAMEVPVAVWDVKAKGVMLDELVAATGW